MAPSPTTRRRGTFAAFGPPVLGDLMFWITALLSLAIGALGGGAVLLVLGVPGHVLGWAWPLGVFAVVGWIAFKFLAMGINTSRALERAARDADESRARSAEAKGRAAGAALGRGVGALTGRRRAHPPEPSAAGTGPTSPPASAAPAGAADAPEAAEPAATTDPATPAPAPDVTVDKAARVLGSMVGRRMAERRRGEGS